ncbi:MAG: DUF6463 family protein [Reinekea sp.]
MTQARFARFLLAITLGHLIVGSLLFAPYLAQLPTRGWVNATGPDFMEGSVAIWFMLFAWPLLLLVVQFWRSNAPVSRPFLWLCVIGSLFGVSLMPASGFWLILVLGGVGLVKGRGDSVAT